MLSLSVLPGDFLGRNWMSSSPVELKMKPPVPIIIKTTQVPDTKGKRQNLLLLLFKFSTYQEGPSAKSFDCKKKKRKKLITKTSQLKSLTL